MQIVAIGWAYVVLMMVLAEALGPGGSVLGALVTLLLYGVLPLSIVLYVGGARSRARARHLAGAAVDSEAVSESGASERCVQTCPIKAQSTAVARATASICNAERARLDATSGRVGFAHSFSGDVDPGRGGQAAGDAVAPVREEP